MEIKFIIYSYTDCGYFTGELDDTAEINEPVYDTEIGMSKFYNTYEEAQLDMQNILGKFQGYYQIEKIFIFLTI